LPSLPPNPTFRGKAVLSQASLFSAREETGVEIIGT
jgi:hypothetical protein